MHHRFYELAYKLSFLGRNNHHRLGAVVVRGGAILSKAVNHDWNHAEEIAVRPHRDYRGAKIYIARSNRGMSKPCPACLTKIKEAGIRTIFYNDANKELRRERV